MGKLILLLILMLAAVSVYGQNEPKPTNREIIKYNFGTYTGTPIERGWLFSDSEYKKLYKSYTAMDSLTNYFEIQRQVSKTIDEMNFKLGEFQSERSLKKDELILVQQETIGNLRIEIKNATDLNDDILKQFFKLGKIRLHKGTTIKVGLGAALATYLIVK